MQKIKLLDCTLRDGGYVNNWEFGNQVMQKVVKKVLNAGADVIELGYLSTKNSGNIDVARFSSECDARRLYVPSKRDSQDYAVMVNLGEFPIENMPVAQDDSPIIRVAFHKKNLNEAFEYFAGLEKLGYRYFIQPMGVLNYNDEEFVQLVGRANCTNAEAFYIVDSFGVIEMKDFRRLIFIADCNLHEKMTLGYHAHNNLQQAYSNAKYMVEQNLEHNLIIDASVFGMGRGAGNLNIELFAAYLNQNHQKNYNIEPILEVFDECLKPIFASHFWGYSLPFYLSSIHNCHPNYASFFSEKNTLSVKSMHELLGMISDEDRISFSKEKASEYYMRYQENYINDLQGLDFIANEVGERSVVILAPGSSLKTSKKDIDAFILEHKSAVFGVGQAADSYKYDFLFVSNEKRSPNVKPDNVLRIIKTSNLPKNEEDILLNYSSYVIENEVVADNPTLMLLKVFIAIGVQEVTIAGFDGFSADPNENYFQKGLSMGSSVFSKEMRNEQTSIELAKLMDKIKVNFLTPSKYIQI